MPSVDLLEDFLGESKREATSQSLIRCTVIPNLDFGAPQAEKNRQAAKSGGTWPGATRAGAVPLCQHRRVGARRAPHALQIGAVADGVMPMNQHCAAIKFDQLAGTEDYVAISASGSQERYLAGLGPVNLFVGPNNAGKSRFLRALFKADKLVFRPAGVDLRTLTKSITDLHELVQRHLGGNIVGYGPLEGPGAFGKYRVEWLTEGERLFDELREKLQALISNKSFSPTIKGGFSAPSEQDVRRIHEALLPPAQQLESDIAKIAINSGGKPRVYVPVLRGLRPLPPADATVYEIRTRQDYQLRDAKGEVFTGLSMYAALQGLRDGPPEHREIVRAYQTFLSQELFDGQPIELTPRQGADVIHLRIGSENEYPIFALGDGMQTVIILTFAAFTASSEKLLFVEEPDTHLHPGM